VAPSCQFLESLQIFGIRQDPKHHQTSDSNLTTAMHELVTIAVVPQIEVKGLLMILQGLCAMTPVRQLEWRLTFEGPRANPLPGIGPALLQSRKPSNQSLWKELNDQLIRQSYYIVISYDVYSSDFGRGETANVDTAAADGDQ
jgi:hypothetical protein